MDARILTLIALGAPRFCNLPRVIWWQNFARGDVPSVFALKSVMAHRSLR
jgi:hypothetical protein